MADTGRRAPLATQTDTANDTATTESRMRRALGLGSGSGQSTPQQRPEQARARHRFVQDGGVPVVNIGAKPEPETAALRERIASLEAQLEAERHAHAGTRRALDAEHHTVTALQTRLAHNELTHRDALEQERRMREAAQEALQALRQAEPVRRRAVPDREPEPEPTPERMPQAAALEAAIPVKRGRGRPRSAAPPEPKPVRWWTPSYRAQKTDAKAGPKPTPQD